MRKTFLIAGAVCVAAFIAALAFNGIASSQTRDEGTSANVATRLQTIIDNQKTIMQKLDDIKNELQIVKVRSTRR